MEGATSSSLAEEAPDTSPFSDTTSTFGVSDNLSSLLRLFSETWQSLVNRVNDSILSIFVEHPPAFIIAFRLSYRTLRDHVRLLCSDRKGRDVERKNKLSIRVCKALALGYPALGKTLM